MEQAELYKWLWLADMIVLIVTIHLLLLHYSRHRPGCISRAGWPDMAGSMNDMCGDMTVTHSPLLTIVCTMIFCYQQWHLTSVRTQVEERREGSFPFYVTMWHIHWTAIMRGMWAMNPSSCSIIVIDSKPPQHRLSAPMRKASFPGCYW